MSTKRTSNPEFQQQDNAKRAKVVSLSETTLQDLPIELLEDILIKAVVMDIKGMKLAKYVWTEKVDLVISRLGTVCALWNSVLATNFLRNKVHRILEDTAQGIIRLELLQQSLPMNFAINVVALKDEMFVLLKMESHDFSIGVHDRNDMNAQKDVIPLPGCKPLSLSACSVSNCVYLLNRKLRLQGSILRISRDDDHRFIISAVMDEMWLPDPTLSVTSTGDLIISRQRGQNRALVSIYNADGSLKHEVKLSKEITSISQIIQKPNGNLVLVSYERYPFYLRSLKEVDLNGTLIRQFPYSEAVSMSACQADISGRLLITQRMPNNIFLVDSEFNFLTFMGPRLDDDLNFPYEVMHYDAEKNEIVWFTAGSLIFVLRFTDDELSRLIR